MTDSSFSQLPSQQLRKDLSFGLFNWKTAEEQYQQGKYFDALCSTVRYIDEEKGVELSKDPEAGIKISHGSVQMYITIKNEQLQVLAPFVNIAKAQKMIILRKICEINFNVLNLAKIECREDVLCFTYSCPLAGCEPWKMYDTLKEICWTADKYDDDFIILHEASWVYEPNITGYAIERKEQCWNGFKLYLQEAKTSVGYLLSVRCPWLAWDVLYMTLLKIDHLCAPQGMIKNQLETNINKLYEKRDVNDLINDGMHCLEALDKLPQSAFFTQLYDISTFVPARITGSATNIQTALKPFLTDSLASINKTEYISAYLCLQKGIFKMLYNYRFNEIQWKHLEAILAANHRIPMKEATNQLYDQLFEFYNNPRDIVVAPAPDKKEEKKSLFAGWFS